MSKVVDERVVEMRFDNQQFESGVKTSMSTLDKLKEKLNLKGAAKGLDEVNASAKRVNMSGLGAGVEAVSAKFSALQVMGVTALANITNSAINAGKNIVSALTIDPVMSGFEEYETQINAVQTILANTSNKGTTLDQVNAALDELNHYADLTIYNFTEMTRNIGTFTAAGVDLDTSVSAIQGIANVAAISGSTSQQASVAMYQLSQALAAGTVKLQDWNSVVNAGMGGEIFQNALKETSELLGTGAEAAIKAKGSFRESLQTGWLTSEVLTETLKKFTTSGANEYVAEYTGLSKEAVESALETAKAQYGEADAVKEASKALAEKSGKNADEIESVLSMAQTAEDAATKVKTFSQLWDTLKEAAQSGWTQTWEILIGDFEEAKELLTSISDVVSDFINKTSDRRNNMLEEAMTSSWDKLITKINEAGVETDTFEDKVKEIAKDSGYNVDDLVKRYGSLEEAFQKGAISSDILQKAINELKGSFTDLDEIQGELKIGDTGKDVEEVQKALKALGYDLGEFGADGKYGKVTEEAIKAFQKANDLEITGVVDDATLNALKEASADTVKLTDDIGDLINNITELGGREILIESFKNILSSIVDVIKPISEAFREIFPPMTADQLLDGIKKFNEFTKTLKVSEETAQKIHDTFKGVFSVLDIGVDAIKALGSGALSLIKNFTGLGGGILTATSSFGNFLSNIRDTIKETDLFGTAVDKIVAFLSDGIQKVKEFGKSLAEGFKTPNFEASLGFFKTLWDIITQVGIAIAKTFGSITKTISEALGKGDIFEVLNSGLIAGILVWIQKFTKTLDDAFGDAGGVFENVKGILDDVRGCFQAYQDQLKAGTLIKIATAIGILAAALFVLSTIDPDSLNSAIGAITVLFVELVAAMAAMKKFAGSSRLFDSSAVKMVAMSAAILILASALRSLSGLSWDQLAVGLAGISAILWELVAVSVVMSKSGSKMIKGSLGLIALAAAMKILASACKDFATMSWEEIGKGLAAIGALLLELAAFTNLAGNAKHITRTGLSMVLLAASMKIFASAMKDFGGMEWTEIGKGLAGMGGALAEVAIAMNLMPKGSVLKATGLVVAAASLKILASALNDFKGMSWDEIGRGLAVMGGALAELAIGLNLMKGTLRGSAALLIAAAALAIMAPVIKTLGGLSWTQIAKGLIALGGAFAVIGVAGALLAPLIPSILGLAAAFALLGVAMIGIGAGLALVGVGLTSIAVSGAAAATSLVAALTVIVTGILDLIPTIAKIIGEGIVEVAKVIGEYAPQLAESFLKLIAESLKSLATYAPQITDSLAEFLIGVINSLSNHMPALIEAFVGLLASVFEGVVQALNGLDAGNLLKGVAAVGIMSALAYALAGVAALIPAAMTGLAGIGVLIGELTAILAAFGGIAQIPGVSWLVEEGGDFLSKVGNAIGKFVGSIIGGFGEGVTSSFPEIGTNLSKFMANLQPFIEGAKQIDESALTGVSMIVDMLGQLTGQNIFESIAEFITGTSSIDAFKTQLDSFGDAIISFSNKLTENGGIDSAAIEAAANAGQMLAALKANLPGDPGAILGLFTSNQNLGNFGEQASSFIDSIIDISNALTENGTINSEAIEAAANAGSLLSALKSSLPEDPGAIAGLFASNQNLGNFGTQAKSFIGSIIDVSNALTENGTINVESITAAVNAGRLLSALKDSLPEDPGALASLFASNQSLGGFGEQARLFISSIIDVSNALTENGGVNEEAIGAATRAGQLLSALKNSLPEDPGAIAGLFKSSQDLGDFGTQAQTFGEAIAAISSALTQNGGVNEEAIGAATRAGQLLSALKNSLPEDPGAIAGLFKSSQDLGDFGTQAQTFGEAIAAISSALTQNGGVNEEAISAAVNAGRLIASLQKALPEEHWFDGKMSLTDFKTRIVDFGSAMGSFGESVGTIDEGKINAAISAGRRIATFATSLVDMDTSGIKTFAADGIGQWGIQNIGKAVGGFSDAVADVDTAVVSKSITAANRLKTFVNGLSGFDNSGIENFKVDGVGKKLKSYSNAVAEVNVSNVSKSITAANRLKSFVTSLSGFDNSGISKFNVSSLGTKLKTYSESAAGVNAGAIASSVSGAQKLTSFISSLSGIDTSGVSKFKSAVDSLGQTNVGNVVKAFSGASSKLSSAGMNMMSSLAKGMSSGTGSLKSTTSGMMNSAISSITGKSSAFSTAGSQLGAKLASGISSKRGAVVSAARSIATAAANATRGGFSTAYSAGSNLGAGYVSGVNAKISAAYQAGYAVGAAGARGINDGQHSNSPSKLAIQSGKWLGEGYQIGIEAMAKSVHKTSTSLGEEGTNSISSAISKMSSMIDTDMDSTPTIRPVVDMTNVEAQAKSMGSLFSNPLLTPTSNIRAINAMMREQSQNGQNDDVVYAINKLRKDLGNVGNTYNNVNGVTYDNGSEVSAAVETLIRAAQIERRR